ncbi:MAG: hypothetical protein LDLANPLL_02805 [Turneriella sp.]|nr:hypothetical protein [Turneriella sp.]
MRFFSPFFVLLVVALFSNLFSLEIFINRSYTTKEKPEAIFYASGEGPMFLRVYRIEDVNAYLTGQANAHTASLFNERIMQPGYFLWKSVIDNFEHSLYRLARRYMRSDFRNILRDKLGLQKHQFPFRDRFPEENLFAPLKYPIVNSQTIEVRARYWHAKKHYFEGLKPGYYLVEISQGRHIAHAPLVISDIAMVTKTSPYNVLFYAVNLLTGKALEKGGVTAYKREKVGDKEVHTAKANFNVKEGIAYSENVEYLKDSQGTLYVLADGDNYAFSDIYTMDVNRELYNSAIYTERPVYRMGDTVSVRAVFVRKHGSAAHGKVAYKIQKGNEVIFSSQGNLTQAGTIAFDFKTESLKPARYIILIELGGEKHYGSFLIEQYKKPETRSNLTIDKNTILSGETTVAELSAAYYSGEALSKAQVEVVIERKRISYPWWYGFSDADYYGDAYDYSAWDFVREYAVTLDTKGKLRIPIDTTLKEFKIPQDADYTYRIRTTVKAQNREETQAATRFKVYRAPVELRLTQDSWYFAAGKPITFTVSATSIYNQKAVAQEVKAVLYLREYDSKARVYRNTQVAEQTINLGANGVKAVEFSGVKRGGLYQIQVSAVNAGRMTDDTLETYVYGDDSYYAMDSTEGTISVSANKKEYSLYETAEFQIQMPAAKKLAALVVIENERIVKYKYVPDAKSLWIYKEELKNNLTPNFDISVLAFGFDKHPRFYSGQTQVVLPPKHRALRLEVVSDRERYRPGEEANFVVRTFDSSQKPVSAEFSLGIVDEAIYSLHEDSLKSLSLKLNPKLANAVVTVNSLAFSFYGYGAEKSLYALYREQMAESAALRKGEAERVKIRKNFKDTAFFTAQGKTNAAGVSTLHVRLPDNLTEWRVTTHANTNAGLSGSQRTKITVSKDFALRLARPRFLRERDNAKLRLLVSNQLKEKQTATFETKFSALKLLSKIPEKLDIPAGEERYFDFTVDVPEFPKDAKASLQFIARTKVDNDGLEIELPIYPYGVENFVASQKLFSENESAWKTKVVLPQDARVGLGVLQISYTPGVLPSVLETLPYLIMYPYGCVEQTLSTFLPALWASSAAEKLKLPLPVKKTELKEITDQGLRKLYGYQHADGGWGWWSDDPTDLYMTAYTLWGLVEAKKAGIPIDNEIFLKGVKYLSQKLTEEDLRKEKNSYAEHRLIFAERVAAMLPIDKKLKDKIYADWKWILSGNFNEPSALALILEGAIALSWKDIESLALKTLKKLEHTSKQGAYFERAKKDGYFYWYNDREETTAQVLNALLQLKNSENNALEEKLVQYLIAQKKEQRWRSTKLSALVTKGLASYALKTQEKLTSVKVVAEVNGVKLTKTYNPKKSTAKDLEFNFTPNSKEANLNILRTGNGFFLLRAEWKHYLNKPLASPREGKFRANRQYFSVNKNGNVYSKGKSQYTFKAGDLVMAEVSLAAPKGNEYLLLEDMIPAGFEPLNDAELVDLGSLRYDTYANMPSAVTRLDERVALAKTYLYENNFTPRAFYRAVFPGKYQAMPAQGGLMYYPETFAYSAADVITIED